MESLLQIAIIIVNMYIKLSNGRRISAAQNSWNFKLLYTLRAAVYTTSNIKFSFFYRSIDRPRRLSVCLLSFHPTLLIIFSTTARYVCHENTRVRRSKTKLGSETEIQEDAEEDGEKISCRYFNEIANRYDIRANFLRGKTRGTEQTEQAEF